MENASKALIIAGAILISIVLVTLGVLIIRNFNVKKFIAPMQEQEKQVINEKFQAFQGRNITGTNVKSMLSLIESTNGTFSENGEARRIYISYVPSGTAMTHGTNAVGNTGALNYDPATRLPTDADLETDTQLVVRELYDLQWYIVDLFYDLDGVISKIDITEQDHITH